MYIYGVFLKILNFIIVENYISIKDIIKL